jgi:GWxTD domain-containing protein
MRWSGIALLLIAAGAAAASPKLLPDQESWRRDIAAQLCSAEELKEFDAQQTDAQRAVFIETFWARRDPTPSSAKNECRLEIERRVRYADSHFTTGRRKGARSDFGRVHILLGPPDKVSQPKLTPSNYSAAGGRLSDTDPASGLLRGAQPPILWTYEHLPTGLGVGLLEVTFQDEYGFGNYTLNTSGPVDMVLRRARDLLVVRPDLDQAPDRAADALAIPTPPSSEEMEPAQLERLRALAAGGTTASPTGSAVHAYAFRDQEGRVALHVALESHDRVLAAAVSEEGELSAVASGAGEMILSGLDPTRQYRLLVASAKEGGAASWAPLELPVMSSGEFSCSSLILAAGFERLESTAAPHERPFCFGSIRLLARPGQRYQSNEELLIGYQLYNLGVAGSDSLPEVTVEYHLLRNDRPYDSIPKKRLELVPVGDAAWMAVEQLALAGMQPGHYRLQANLVDRVAKKLLIRSAEFQLAAVEP